MRSRRLSAILVAATLLLALCVPAVMVHAQPPPQLSTEEAFLIGFDENPPVISNGFGSFSANIGADAITYQLNYQGIPTAIQQAHIHIGNPWTNGTIIVYLCSNLGNIPAGVTALPCPEAGTTLTGTIVAADVLQAVDPENAQRVLLAAGDLEGLKGLLLFGAAYVNVHSEQNPSGEIRGQVNPRAR
jgi:hypothetical protein